MKSALEHGVILSEEQLAQLLELTRRRWAIQDEQWTLEKRLTALRKEWGEVSRSIQRLQLIAYPPKED